MTTFSSRAPLCSVAGLQMNAVGSTCYDKSRASAVKNGLIVFGFMLLSTALLSVCTEGLVPGPRPVTGCANNEPFFNSSGRGKYLWLRVFNFQLLLLPFAVF